MEGPVRVTSGSGDGGCALTVDGITLEPTRSKCDVTKLDERYPIGEIGEATFVARSAEAYAGKLTLNAGAAVKPHQHDASLEIVVIVKGRGSFTIDGGLYEVGAGDEIVIPKATPHSFIAGPVKVEAVQFYVPPGPEERFRPKEKK